MPLLKYFYPRSPRGERPLTDDVSSGGKIISIHAPRVGSDLFLRLFLRIVIYFYPRSPRGERRPFSASTGAVVKEFLSTLPAWGATFLLKL